MAELKGSTTVGGYTLWHRGNFDPNSKLSTSSNAVSASILQTARTISASGDGTWTVTFDGSANTSSDFTLASTGVSAGTYTKLTVDTKGRITTATTLLASDVPTLNQDTTGNAATATKLQTSRTISATGDGSWSVSFDGSTNTSSVITLVGTGVSAGSYGSTVSVPVITVDSKGRITTATNTAIQLASTSLVGLVQLTNSTTSTSITTAATANSVKMAYDVATAAIPLTQKGVANGVASLDANGLVPSSQLPSYVDDVLEYANLAAFPVTGETGKIYVAIDTNLIYRWTGSTYINISSGSGTADTALKLVNARTISATGDASWTVTFDGSANTSSSLTLANTGVSAGTYTKLTVDAKGRVTTATTLLASDIPTLNQNTTGNAATATKLQTARTINGVSFDGSVNIITSATGSLMSIDQRAMSPANVFARAVSVYFTSKQGLDTLTTGTAYGDFIAVNTWNDASGGIVNGLFFTKTTTPAIYHYTGAFGSSTWTSKQLSYTDSDITGNAATATKLQTARTLSASGDGTWSVTFDGSANTSSVFTLANSGATAGSYTKVTVDTKGRVTTGTTLVATDIPSLDASKITTGTLPVARGGTGLTSTTQGGIMYGSGAAALSITAAGTTGQVLASNGTAAPTWATLDFTYLPDASIKKSVRVATTANITLSGTQTIDGIAVVAADRVLVKDQATASQNGIYLVAAGAWTRTTDADTSSKIAGAEVNIDSGTINGGQRYDTDFKTTDTIGTTTMTWNRVVTTGFASTLTGLTPGIASTGTSQYYSREDHVHPLQTTVSGNAGTATKLQTARTINGVSFDGSANITIADSTKLPLTGGSVSGQLTVTNATAASSTTTGALVVTGGVGIGGNLYAGDIYTNGQLVGNFANTATNIAGGSLGAIPIQTAAGGTSFISPGASGQLLQMGANTATWVNTSSLAVNWANSSNLANDITGGSANQILYQTGANLTGYIVAPTTASTVLTWSGTGFTWAQGGGGGSISLANDTTTDSTAFYPTMAFNTSSGTLSTTYVSSTKLFYNPNTGQLNATSFNSLSDRTKKTNISTINSALDKVNAMRGVSFDWLDTKEPSLGVIAQEIEEVLPEVVYTANTGEKSVNYSAIIGVLIEAIKEQQGQINILKEKLGGNNAV